MDQTTEKLERKIEDKFQKELSELNPSCSNDVMKNKFQSALDKNVKSYVRQGDLAKAKRNAGRIMNKILAIRKKCDGATGELEELTTKIEKLKTDGIDITQLSDRHHTAQRALQNGNFRTYNAIFKELRKMILKLEEPERAGKTSKNSAQISAEENPYHTSSSFPDVMDIRSFVTCKLCNKVIGDRTITQCPECGKRYHSSCVFDIDSCLICQTDLDEASTVSYEGITEELPAAASLEENLTSFMSWYDKWFNEIVLTRTPS